MSARDKTSSPDVYDVNNYDRESSAVEPQLAESLTHDFPADLANYKSISVMSVREINFLLYDQTHNASSECYMYCLEKFTDNLWFYDKKNVHEILETSFPDIKALQERVQEIIRSKYGTTGEDGNNPLDTAWHLLNKLSAIIDKERQMRFIEDGVNHIREYVDESHKSFSNDVAEVRDMLSLAESDASDIRLELSKALSEANKDTISVMGIFTSIIVIIMSLVITSSSWLNNASGASAIVAFIVPSCVSILVVCALTYFLNLLTREKSEKIIPWIVIGVITFLIGCTAIWIFSGKEALPHNRLVFEVDKYASIDPNDATGERIINIHFTETVMMSDGEHDVEVVIDNQKESDCLIHNGLIYYCTTHNRFE